MIDSTTAHHISEIITLNPSWSFVVLFALFICGFVIYNLFKNTTITSKIFEMVSKHDVIAETVSAIRKDQVVSNQERKEQATEIKQIKQRLDTLEADVNELKCINHQCPNRKG